MIHHLASFQPRRRYRQMCAPVALMLMSACADSHSSVEVAEGQSQLQRGPAAMVYDTGWRVDQHVRRVEDIDGDGRADLIGFGNDGVYVGAAQPGGFAAPALVVSDFGNNMGWTPANSVRTVADVNGDGRLDIIGFGPTLEVALKNVGAGYSAPLAWSIDYSATSQWNVATYPPLVGDVDGNGRADVVGINDWGVYVSRSVGIDGWISITAVSNNSIVNADNAGSSYLIANRKAASVWEQFQIINNNDGTISLLSLVNGRYITTDLNNGGRLIASQSSIGTNEKFRMIPAGAGGVAFQAVSNNLWVSADLNIAGTLIANRPSVGFWELFVLNGFTPKELWTRDFTPSQGWDATKHLRILTDVNHDGTADLVAFKSDGVYVALSNGVRFLEAHKWSDSFGYDAGWRIGTHIRVLANVDGDAFPDIVGMGPDGVYVALGTGAGFAPATKWLNDLGDTQGWTSQHPRFVADIDGDGAGDLVGIKDDHVYVARNAGTSFAALSPVLDSFTSTDGWQVDKHPRFLADVDGDGALEVVGFKSDAVYWDHLSPVATIPLDWDAPTCATSRLAAPAPGFCEGPWRYTQTNRRIGQDSSCQQVCTSYKSCPKWENPITTTTSTDPTEILGSGTAHATQVCLLPADGVAGSCSPITYTGGAILKPTTECQEKANALLAGIKSTVDTDIDKETTFDSAAALTQRKLEAENAASAVPNYTIKTTNPHSTGGVRIINTWDEQWACHVTVVTPVAGTAANEACGCATFAAGTCEHDDGASTELFTAPGKERPVGPGISGQTCMTYDDLPVTTPTEINTKFDRLWTALRGQTPPTVTATMFHRAIVSRLKLMYELWGEQLSHADSATDALHRAISLYSTDQDINPNCGVVDAPVPPTSCTAPAVANKRGELIRCQRLLGSHASNGVASLAAIDCLPLLTGYLDLKATASNDESCGGVHLRDLGFRTLLQLEDKQFGVINSAPTSLGALPRQLWLLDSWYAASKRAEGLGVFTMADQQRRDTSYLLGRFWERVRANSTADSKLAEVLKANTPEQAESALGLSALASRESDQAVINALFTVPGGIQPENVTLTRPPLRGLPQLAILGDALRPFIDDLNGLAVYHDIACKFRECRASAFRTPSRSAWNILASLEARDFGATVAANTFALGGWNSVFSRLASQQAAFNAAVAEAVTKPGGLAAATTEADVHPLARPLWLLYQHALAFHGHFEATGQFESSTQNQIQGSLLERDQQTTVLSLRRRADALQTSAASYQRDLISLVQAQLNVMQDGAQVQNLTEQRQHKALEMDQKSANLEGLRASGSDEDDAFASLAASFANIQAAIPTGAYVSVGNNQTFELNGRSGKFTTSHDLAAIAAHVGPVMEAGQMLVMNTSGSWTPTCSISTAAYLRDDGGDPAGADLRDAEIGPEGYALSVSGSDVQAHSAGHSLAVEESVGVSTRLCVEHSTDPAGDVFFGVKAEACVYADTHVAHSNTWSGSSGSESRETVAFAKGLRMDNTPFPEAPVGSLLVVLVDPQGAVRDVRVVRSGDTSILIEGQSTPYFVVNDRQCDTAGTGHSLTVSMRTMAGALPVAEKALAAMVDVLAYMRTKQQLWAQQGALLPDQPTLMRQEATGLLPTRLGSINVADVPAPLISLFDAFVSHEIVATERRIEIAATQRSLDLDLIDMRTINDELDAGAAHARLQRLIPQWLLRNLDHDRLRVSLVDLLSVSRDYLKPILELWYPNALASVSTDATGATSLTSADIDTSLITLAVNASDFVNNLLDAYEHGTFGAKAAADQLPVIVINFPQPKVPHAHSTWREVDETRAQRVWDAIKGKTMGHFEVNPEDFYSRNGGDAILACTEVTPVIRRMGIFVARPSLDSNDTLNRFGRTFQGYGSANQSFVTPAGPQVYQLTNPDTSAPSVWQSFTLPVRYGEYEQAWSMFDTIPVRTRPVGLSAAGTFDIDFSILKTLDAEAGFVDPDNGHSVVTDVALVMELDSRASSTLPTWLQRCKPAQ